MTAAEPRRARVATDLLHVGILLDGVERPVGRLARRGPRIFFEHAPAFLAAPLPISPVHLPPRSGVFEETSRVFDGLHGVFADSMPDGWGRLLLDRALAQAGVSTSSLSPLDRLAFVGTRAMGALTYRPEAHRLDSTEADEGLDSASLAALARASLRVLDGEENEVVTKLLLLGGSSGGARPKIVVGADSQGTLVHDVEPLPAGFAHWLVKFPGSGDARDAGLLEQAYAMVARSAGIEVPETRLFARRFFGVRRFDRNAQGRVHVHTFAGMFHVDTRVPSLDAISMMNGVRMVTRDERDVSQMFRRLVFNVLAHNRDDHAKNTSFVLHADGAWRLSPAYDLTFSNGPAGEHWTTVDGEGRAPKPSHLLSAAKAAGLKDVAARAIVDEVRTAVAAFPAVARDAGCTAASIKRVARAITAGSP